MFGTFNNPVNAYKSVGIETNIATADPHRLILLLFEGAKLAIFDAKTQMAADHVAEKGMAISKAIDIITNGLKASLDLEQGGELALQLTALYDYMVTRLLFANLKNNAAVLDEVLSLLGEIHSAWEEIGKQSTKDTPPASTAVLP